MTFQMVTVSWDETDPAGDPASGSVTFQLTAPLIDGATGQVAETLQKTYFFTSGTGTSDALVANDSSGATPTGTAYRITVALAGQQARTFISQILHAAGSAQTLGYLEARAAVPAVQYAQYYPLAGGVAFAGPVAPLDTVLTDAASVTVGAAANAYTLPLSAAVGASRAVTLQPGLDGQQLTMLLVQPASGGPCGVSWSGADWGRAGSPPSLGTGAGAADLLGFQYRAALSAWRFLGVN